MEKKIWNRRNKKCLVLTIYVWWVCEFSNLNKMSHGIFEEYQIETWASYDFIVLELVHTQLLWQKLKTRHLENWECFDNGQNYWDKIKWTIKYNNKELIWFPLFQE